MFAFGRMHEDDASIGESAVNELVSKGQPDEQVGLVSIGNWNAIVDDRWGAPDHGDLLPIQGQQEKPG